jgi:hypothetical protein
MWKYMPYANVVGRSQRSLVTPAMTVRRSASICPDSRCRGCGRGPHQIRSNRSSKAVGTWGIRWIDDLGEDDLDPHLLMWKMRCGVAVENWPEARTVVAFRLSGVIATASSWWLVVADGDADMCEHDPGYDVAATVSTSLGTLTMIWRGDLSWSRSLKDGLVSIEGPAIMRRAVPTWLGQAAVAAVPRPA